MMGLRNKGLEYNQMMNKIYKESSNSMTINLVKTSKKQKLE